MLHSVSVRRRMSDVVSSATTLHESRKQKIRDSTADIKARLREASERNRVLSENAQLHAKMIEQLIQKQRETEQQILRAKETSDEIARLKEDPNRKLEEKRADKITIEEEKNKIKALEDEITKLRQKCIDAHVRIKSTIASTKESLQEIQKQSKQDITERARSIAGLVEKAQSSIQRLATDKTNESGRHAEEVGKLKEALAGLKQLNDEAITASSLLKERMDAIIAHADALRANVIDLVARMRLSEKNHSKEMSDVNARIAQCEEERKQVSYLIANETEQKQKLHESIKENKNELESKSKEIDDLKGQLEEAVAASTRIRGLLDANEAINKSNTDELSKSYDKIKLENDIEVERLTGLLLIAEQDKQTTDTELMQKMQDLTRRVHKINELEARNKTLEMDLGQSETNLKESLDKLEISKNSKRAIESRLESCNEAKKLTELELGRVKDHHKRKTDEHTETSRQTIEELYAKLTEESVNMQHLRDLNATGLTDLEQKTGQITELESRIKETKAQLETKTEEVFALTDQIREKESDLSQKATEIESMAESSALLKTQLQNNESKIKELTARIKELTSEHENKLNSTQAALSDMSLLKNNESTENKNLVVKLRVTEQELGRVNQSIASLQKENEGIYSDIARTRENERISKILQTELTAEVKSLRSKNEELQETISLLKKQIETSKIKQRTSEADIAKIKQGADEAKQSYLLELTRLEAELRTTLTENKKLITEIEAARSERDTRKSTIETMHKILHPGEEDVPTNTKIVESIKKLKREHLAHQVLFNDIANEAGCTGNGDAAACIRKSLSASKKVIGALSSYGSLMNLDASNITDTITSLLRKAATSDQQDREISSLKKINSQQESTITGKQNELDTCNTQKEEITLEYSTYKQHTDNDARKLRSRVKELATTITTLDAEIAGNQTTIDDNATSLATMRVSIANISNEKSKLDKQLETLMAENTLLGDENSALNSDRKSLATKVEEINALNYELSSIRADISQLGATQDQLTEAQAELMRLRTAAEDKRRGCISYMNMTEIPIIDRHIDVAVWEEAGRLILQYKGDSKFPELAKAYKNVKVRALKYIEDGLEQCNIRLLTRNRGSSPHKGRYHDEPRLNATDVNGPPASAKVVETESINKIFKIIEKKARALDHGGPLHTITLSMERVTSSLIEILGSLVADGKVMHDAQAKMKSSLMATTTAAIESMKNQTVTIVRNSLYPKNTETMHEVEWGEPLISLITSLNIQEPTGPHIDQHEEDSDDDILVNAIREYPANIKVDLDYITKKGLTRLTRHAILCMLAVVCILWAIAKNKDHLYIKNLLNETETELVISSRDASITAEFHSTVHRLVLEIKDPDDQELQVALVDLKSKITGAIADIEHTSEGSDRTEITNEESDVVADILTSGNDDDDYKRVYSNLSSMTRTIKSLLDIVSGRSSREREESRFGAYV